MQIMTAAQMLCQLGNTVIDNDEDGINDEIDSCPNEKESPGTSTMIMTAAQTLLQNNPDTNMMLI